jgi:uroporphyrinogen decarboxylase
MSNYTHRERVLATLNFEEADRLPIDLLGNATMLLDDAYLKLRNHLKLSEIPPVRFGATANYYDERILEYFDVDFRRLFLKKNPKTKVRFIDDESFIDPWGVTYKKLGDLVNPVNHPLEHLTTVKEVEDYPWPKAEDLFTTEGLAEEAQKIYETSDYALVARNPMPGGFLEQANNLMGMQTFLVSLFTAPDIAHSVINHLREIYYGVYSMFLDAVGPYVQMVEVSDDLGGQSNLIMALETYREFIKPAEIELYNMIHQKAPNAGLFHHTCGAVFNIIPDLIEVGVNILNPVQTAAKGMEPERLKNAFGKSITFHGAIESLKKTKTKDEIVAEVKRKIDILSPGGGYILAPCNHVLELEPEKLIAAFETALEYGRYRK